MILRLENGKRVEVRFTHYPNAPAPYTEARVGWGEEFLLGAGICHPNDQFNKAIGRKVALGRALELFPRDIRRQIWKAYFEFVNNAGK